MSIDEADYVSKPTAAQSYLDVDREMLPGAKHLVGIDSISSQAPTFLCGHICECALKSILSFNGKSEKELKDSSIRHNILGLWNEVCNLTQELDNPPQDWVSQLSRVFNAPHVVRYAKGANFVVFSDQWAMINGTENLVSLAAQIIE